MIDPQHSRFRDRLEAIAKQQPHIYELRELLLNIGGDDLAVSPEPDPLVPALIRNGVLMEGSVKIRRMTPSACHENSAKLWINKKAELNLSGIGYGYALSKDGLWRQHSWCVHNAGIIETTEKREKYFGVLFRDEGADWFAGQISGVTVPILT